MAADDYYTHLASQQIQRLEANKAQTLADLQRAKADADYETPECRAGISGHRSQEANLVALHDQYVRSQTPVEPPELTPEEKAGKTLEPPWITETFGRCRRLPNTASMKNLFRAGMAEVARRRAKGEGPCTGKRPTRPWPSRSRACRIWREKRSKFQSKRSPREDGLSGLKSDQVIRFLDRRRLIERVQDRPLPGRGPRGEDDPQLQRGGQPRPLDRWR